MKVMTSFGFDLNDDNDENDSRAKIKSCIKDIKLWMTVNKLKLNDDKTEFLVITSKYHLSKPNTNSLQIASSEIVVSPSARNLGIVFDSALSMDALIKNVCKATYFQIRNINEIRNVLDDDTAAKLVHALITSRLDNGNALLYGITESQLKKLQQAQNAPLACLLEEENLITFHLFYSVSTGCQFVIEFILKSFFSPGKHFMPWHLLTSANLLIFTIHHVNFVLHIKTSSPFLGHSLPMATEPFTHVLLNSGTHFLQIYVL